MANITSGLRKIDTDTLIGVVIILFFAALGTKLLLSGHAQTPYASTVADKGNLSAPATINPDTTANDGQRVYFGHIWIMTNGAFNELIQDATAASRLRQDTIYLIGGAPVSGYNIIPTMSVQDETLLASDLAARQSYVKAVIYDDEDWDQTPLAQQQDPALYYQLAGQLVHAAGLKFIATPAVDLTTILNPGVSGDTGTIADFISDNIAYNASKYADLIDIQSQRYIQSTSDFTSFVKQASAQAKSANPSIIALSGLSTCNGTPDAQQLANGAVISNPYVEGWWMNVPGSGSASKPNGLCSTVTTQTQINNAISSIDMLPWY